MLWHRILWKTNTHRLSCLINLQRSTCTYVQDQHTRTSPYCKKVKDEVESMMQCWMKTASTNTPRPQNNCLTVWFLNLDPNMCSWLHGWLHNTIETFSVHSGQLEEQHHHRLLSITPPHTHTHTLTHWALFEYPLMTVIWHFLAMSWWRKATWQKQKNKVTPNLQLWCQNHSLVNHSLVIYKTRVNI